MPVSGYKKGFIDQVIRGAVERYRQMVREDELGLNPLYRSRKQILAQKADKSGRSAASWFMKGTVRQVMNLPQTPGSKLAEEVRRQVGTFLGPDKGTTKVVERDGRPVTAGLQKDNPFPRSHCDFEDHKCSGGRLQEDRSHLQDILHRV